MKEWLKSHLFTVIFVAAVVVGMAGIGHNQQLQKTAQKAACERGNILRAQVNTVTGTLNYFIIAAAESREKEARIEAKEGQDRLASINLDIAKQYRQLLFTLQKVPLVECNKLY